MSTANAINTVAHQLGTVSFIVSGAFIGIGYLARTATRRKWIMRIYAFTLVAIFLWHVPPFMQAGYGAVDIAFMLGGILLIMGFSLRYTTFCESCARPITNNRPWNKIHSCPHCGTDLPKPL